MNSFFVEDGDGIIVYTETPVENLNIGDLIDVQGLPGGYEIMSPNHTDSDTPFSITNIIDTKIDRVVEVKSDYSPTHTFALPFNTTVYLIDSDENG